MDEKRNKIDSLPPIQLPPPIVHYYIAAPSAAATTGQPWHQTHAQLPPTPPTLPTKAERREISRRSSHSAIEKRRREKMNDKIDRLKGLIPSCNAHFPTTVQQPIHKLSVLQAAIDYIGELHNHLENSLPKDNPFLKEIAIMQSKRDQIKSPPMSQGEK
ncbi:hypothetical protein BDF21DRAFT_467634 [Thamnidium elegans]|uniref:BHLH domain-containing protein n=1 Tax=Thamnidium elegans TaxID=101142 RepID=A0A8H7SRA2_9FUNG|nr:hypothetical protein INT48_008456 [Thamnidium elegans]KAI8058794.1 hypothetical protein BDF21DRAFT_467634 [Thamnidium elegans]